MKMFRLCRYAMGIVVMMAAEGLIGEVRAEGPVSAKRSKWTTSRFAGTPDPPAPYVVEPAFPNLTFQNPLVIASAAGTNRLFVGEQGGKVFSFPNERGCKKADLMVDLATRPQRFAALFGLTFHPHFQANRQVFLCYNTKNDSPDGTRVSRFEVSRIEPPVIDLATEKVIITWPSGGHNGGCLAFGPEGYLYISAGDAEVPSPPDPRNTGQNLSDLLSSILRIDVDHDEQGRAYRIPADNPFLKHPGARGEIWAYGFRNPWKMSFDRGRGDLWVGDVGWELWELIDRVERGGNYGWSVVEGRQSVHPDGRRGPTPILAPTYEHPHSEAASITGGYVYRGSRLAELKGVYTYGDFQSGKVWGLKYDGSKVTWQGTLADTPLELVAFGEDQAGEVYLLDYERTRQLHRLVRNPAATETNRTFPRRLSETGLFRSTRDHAPSEGVEPYAINASLWSDHAQAERLIGLPGASRIETGENGGWRLPEGAVLARTVSLEMERGNSASRKRIETQVLHQEGGAWRPYSYVWNEEQTDATLAVAEGLSRSLMIRDAESPGGSRTQQYRVHARSECILCHNPWIEKKTVVFGRQSASPLGFTTSQLNKEVVRHGKPVNQLREFERLGLFAQPLPESLEKVAKLADPYDPSADLNRRARAYLQVNCAHCHQDGAGGSATIWLAHERPLEAMQVVGVKPAQGAFGIADARIIAPGDPSRSTLFYRVAKLGGGRMPRAGSNLVDEQGVAMLGDWIAGMPHPQTTGYPKADSADDLALKGLESRSISSRESLVLALKQLTSSTQGAIALLRVIDRGALKDSVRIEAIKVGSRHSSAEVRDLFERFVPESERVVRLGESIDPKMVLALAGNARRGREVFLNNTAAQCKSCHRLEGAGEPLGPDLARIGAKFPKAEMLREILEPSRTIDPKFSTYIVETKQGQVFNGLLIEKTEHELVLKDAQNRVTRVPTVDVEQVATQARSLMPELLLRDLTGQQAADLLEFLGSLK